MNPRGPEPWMPLANPPDFMTAILESSADNPPARWGQERRLEFIDFRLRWDGRLNRADLISFFRISVPQASLDIAKYTELAPDNLRYDRSGRLYVATPNFRPVYPASSTSNFLNDLLAVEAGVLKREASLVGWRPPVAAVPTPGRPIEAEKLIPLLRAVREGTGLRVRYQSLSRLEPSWRSMTPHAFAHDGFRWHIRAYCHEHEDFRDFVIPRMLELEEAQAEGPGAAADTAWHQMIELVLVPNPKLPAAHKRAVELDYGMVDGSVHLRCRRALLFYLLQHLGLHEESLRPQAHQVVLRNPDEIAQLLVAENSIPA